MRNEVRAIVCADIHLSLNPPPARAGEPDWLAAQKRPLDEMRELAKKHNAPILCAGDLFDRWNSPPELINFAIKNVPSMFAIPGQHDLPNHLLDDIRRSAFWTLCITGIVECLQDANPKSFGGRPKLVTHHFPWGVSITPPKAGNSSDINVALVHAYTWVNGKGYNGAPQSALFNPSNYAGYSTVIIGDNHIPWDMGSDNRRDGNAYFFNCGSLMRLRSDQKDHQPRVGLLLADGSVASHYLDISQDVFEETAKETELGKPEGFEKVLEELKALEDHTLDFAEVLRHTVNNLGVDQNVRQYVSEALESSSRKK